MNTYRNKHFESIAWNHGDGAFKAENFVFSPVSSLRSWRSHLFVWRLRKPINLAQVCISNDRAVPTPGFKQYNSRPTQTKTTKQTYRSFDNFYFDFLFLMVYTSVIDLLFPKMYEIPWGNNSTVLLHNYIWSFDGRSLLIGIQKKLELKKKEIFSVDIAKKRTVKSLEFAINLHQCWQKTVHYWFPHHCNKNDYFLSKFKANISTLDTRESQQILLSYTIIIIRNRYIFHYKIWLLIVTNPVLGEIMTDSPS